MSIIGKLAKGLWNDKPMKEIDPTSITYSDYTYKERPPFHNTNNHLFNTSGFAQLTQLQSYYNTQRYISTI